MKFTDQLRKDTDKIWQMLLELPFIKEMGDGSLDLKKFKFYSKQNYLYLKEYEKVAALGIIKSDNPATTTRFFEMLEFTIKGEIELMKTYASELEITEEELKEEKMAPMTRAYSDFIVRTSFTEDLAGIIAAYLPCFWCYLYVFSELKSRGISKENPIYVKSIEVYTSEQMKTDVAWLRDKLDSIAEGKSPEERKKIAEIFLTSCRYEYEFWDAVYNMKRWADEK